MPSVTNLELNHVLSSMLDDYDRNGPHEQNVQAMPVLDIYAKHTRKQAGGKFLQVPVVNRGGVKLVGFDSDEEAGSFVNPQNTKFAKYAWFDHHAGIMMSRKEALLGGIVIDDTLSKNRVMPRSEKQRIFNVLDEKIKEMDYGVKQSKVERFWSDGTDDPKAAFGVRAFITANPAIGVVGGIDGATNTKWRNRSKIDIPASGANADTGTFTRTLDREGIQLRRYSQGRKSAHYVLAGSDAIEQLKSERFAKGSFSDAGFSNSQDLSSGDVKVAGGLPVRYDPYLDDLGLSKYLYIIDAESIFPNELEGEHVRFHEVPHDAGVFVFKRSATWAAGFAATRRNTSGVYSIA